MVGLVAAVGLFVVAVAVAGLVLCRSAPPRVEVDESIAAETSEVLSLVLPELDDLPSPAGGVGGAAVVDDECAVSSGDLLGQFAAVRWWTFATDEAAAASAPILAAHLEANGWTAATQRDGSPLGLAHHRLLAERHGHDVQITIDARAAWTRAHGTAMPPETLVAVEALDLRPCSQR